MKFLRTLSTLPFALLGTTCFLSVAIACTSLNYPTEGDSAASEKPSGPPSPPILLDISFGAPEAGATLDLDPAKFDLGGSKNLSWSDLTKRAREARAQGKFEEVQTSLEQAGIQLQGLPPTNAQRRAVFGMRSRLAIDFYSLNRFEESDSLADMLFEEAEASPGLGGPALADLAYFMAARHETTSEKTGVKESLLPLLKIAVDAAQTESPTRLRLIRSQLTSQTATTEGDYDLARRAIDRAVQDAQTLAPANKEQLASLKVSKARIALAQGDLLTAKASAASASRILQSIDSTAPNRSVAESTIARVVAEMGDAERARAIIAGVRARFDEAPPLPGYAQRIVLHDSARIERALGDDEAARRFFERALELPPVDSQADIDLIEDLQEELTALDAPAP
jgi:tetratricopeptide (TPR) repeat protein